MVKAKKEDKIKKIKDKYDERLFRIIDVNINRCREGLRVIEDTTRFLLDDSILFTKFREIRHSFDRLTRGIYPYLLKERDSCLDIGKDVLDEHKYDVISVISANFKRVEESLRVLEEYGKILSYDTTKEIKTIRFKIYSLEKEVVNKIQEKLCQH